MCQRSFDGDSTRALATCPGNRSSSWNARRTASDPSRLAVSGPTRRRRGLSGSTALRINDYRRTGTTMTDIVAETLPEVSMRANPVAGSTTVQAPPEPLNTLLHIPV